MFIISYKWYVPFSYSIEEVGTRKESTFAADMNNVYNQMEWLKQNENSS